MMAHALFRPFFRLRSLRLLALATLATALAGCFFSPSIEELGYTRCTANEQCPAGRGCYTGLCTPPPWNDEAFARRQLVVVKNPSEEEAIVTGAAVPLRLGAEGLLPASALGVDGRLTYYSFAAEAWRKVPVWRDVYDDHLLLYLPLQEEVPPGGEAQLAWLEGVTDTRDPGFFDDPGRVFPLCFEVFEGNELDPGRWKSFGTGGAPTLSDGRVTVRDNQQIVSTLGLEPPFSLTFKGRINGVTCTSVYLGLTSSARLGLEPPSVGFFIESGLVTKLEVGPSELSTPQQPPDLQSITLDTATHRYRLDVGSQKVRFAVDGEVVGEPKGLFFQGEELYFTVDVDGDCSFDLELVHASPLPYARPTLRAEDEVMFHIVD